MNGAAKAFESCLINFIRCHILFFDKSTPCQCSIKGALYAERSSGFSLSSWDLILSNARLPIWFVILSQRLRCLLLFAFFQLTTQWLKMANVVGYKMPSHRKYINDEIISLLFYLATYRFVVCWARIKDAKHLFENLIFFGLVFLCHSHFFSRCFPNCLRKWMIRLCI